MKINAVLLSISVMLLVACTEQAKQAETQSIAAKPEYQSISGLKTPESVVQAKDGKIYVSEINEFGKDGDGQISVIADGKASLFVDGLDDPKGLVIIDEALYVADKTQIIKVDLKTKEKSVFASADDFIQTPQFLNDLEADPHGNLYVTDSGDILGSGVGGVVYKIDTQGGITKLADGMSSELVRAPNGLLADDTGRYLMVVDFTTGVLYNIDTQTGQVTEDAEGFGGGDGLVHHSSGDVFVSDWKNGKVFRMNRKAEVSLFKDGYQAAADIAITKDEQYLMVPDMKAGVLDFVPVK